ncbi:MAG: hypothetical protein HY070_07860 [Chloroflexi bacterium]|nr:hypothetical protein [Chloroflexota bacterium]
MNAQRILISLIPFAMILSACAAPTPPPTSPTLSSQATATRVPATSPPNPTATSTLAPIATPTSTVVPTNTPLSALEEIYFRELAIPGGKRFDFLRFYSDGNAVLNGAVASDALAAWNSVRGSLTVGNSNIASGKYILRGNGFVISFKVANEIAIEMTGTILGDKVVVVEKVIFTGVTQASTFTRADFAR